MELTSTHNPQLKSIRRAAASGRPTEEGLIVAEGPHLLEEASRGSCTVRQVLVTPAARVRYRELVDRTGAPVTEVSERALASAASTETPQGIVALVRPRAWSWSDLLKPSAPLVVLDRIQDPGNVGTIVRSAEAFGATGVIFLKGCARVANGKVLRATAGSIFRLPFLEEVLGDDLMENLRSSGFKIFALVQQGQTQVTDVNLTGACALLVGNEGAGINPELLDRAERVSIPTAQVESLNAAIACSIALYEARRQRRAE